MPYSQLRREGLPVHRGDGPARRHARGAGRTAGESGQRRPFLSLVQAVSSSPLAAQSVREVIAERIRPPDDGQPLSHEWRVRQALIGSQLMGLAFQRYILRAEPVVTADADQLAAWVGPAIDRYLHEPLAERGSGGSDR